MELQGFIYEISYCDVYIDAGAFLDVLIGGVFDKAYHIFYLDVFLLDTYLPTNQGLQVLHRNELGVYLDEVWCCISPDVEENTHIL